MSMHSDGLSQFLDVLPSIVRERLERGPALDTLIEVVLDYGRPAEARYRMLAGYAATLRSAGFTVTEGGGILTVNPPEES